MERRVSQNLISLSFDRPQLDAIDTALTALETACTGLLALQPDDRRNLFKMGDKSEAFCRQALMVLGQNPQIVPPSLGLAEAQADLVALDQLRPRMARLTQLLERMSDSETALGSDIIAAALQGYALLKVAGKNQGLESTRLGLAERFRGQGRRAAREPEAAEAGE